MDLKFFNQVVNVGNGVALVPTPSDAILMNLLKKTRLSYGQKYPGFGVYSTKVFLGGLPPDIDEDEIAASFAQFGKLKVDWPGKSLNPRYMFPPKGYAFLYFQNDFSVRRLIRACLKLIDGRLSYPVASPSMRKMIEVRPWRISDAITVLNPSCYRSSHWAVFVGGIPRPMTSGNLAALLQDLFGNVSYVGIFMDGYRGYPRGSGIVYFSKKDSYLVAVMTQYVSVKTGNIFRLIEMKPYMAKFSSPTFPFVYDKDFASVCSSDDCGGSSSSLS